MGDNTYYYSAILHRHFIKNLHRHFDKKGLFLSQSALKLAWGKGIYGMPIVFLALKSLAFESYVAQAVTDVNLVPCVLEESIKKALKITYRWVSTEVRLTRFSA